MFEAIQKVSGYGLEDRGRIPNVSPICVYRHCVHTKYGTHPPSCQICAGSL